MLATPKDLFHLWECFCWCICKLPISRSASLRHCTRPGIWNVSSFRFRLDTIAAAVAAAEEDATRNKDDDCDDDGREPPSLPTACPSLSKLQTRIHNETPIWRLLYPRWPPWKAGRPPPCPSTTQRPCVCVCVCAIQCSDKLLEVATNLQLVVSQQQQRQNSTKRSSCCWENQQKTKEKRQRKWCFAGWSRGEGGVWWGFSFWREHKVEFSGIAWPAFSAPCRALWLHLMTLIKLPTDDNLSLALDSGHRLLNPNRISRSGSKTSGSGTGRSGRNSRIWL